ncbi:glycosyl transferase family 1 [Caballeronia sp. LZ016]|uniref:glycosyl transferase family 1 n=1 Tax=Caballeronia sp. LZ016 TaxID=3038554 RepID=UPI00286484FC|nr:glycosyl transferase family 1 [Caballeronia sp. LZ016]MDR5737543.1 glycosyl transferase family 1 [Caballeronia sp. LZ016]
MQQSHATRNRRPGIEMSHAFSLERLESRVHDKQFDEAISLVFELQAVLRKKPFIDPAELMAAAPQDGERFYLFVSRAAAALAAMFAHPEFALTDARWQRLLPLRALIWRIFTADVQRNGEGVARSLIASIRNERSRAPEDAARKLTLVFSSEWDLPLDLAQMWNFDHRAAATLGMAIAAESYPGSERAYARRNAMLQWLPDAMSGIVDLLEVDVAATWALYMHCSYGDVQRRHDVKRSINVLVRNKLAEYGLTNLPASPPDGPARKRPLMLVFPEAFTSGHSIVRTHSRTLIAARERFETVALCSASAIGDEERRVFDRVYELPESGNVPASVGVIRDFALSERPDVFYMPSVGMSAMSIFMSNLRIAPLQIAGLGHPATTHSDCIDYVSVEEDYVGDASCFSEKLMLLPKDGQPYAPSARLEPIGARRPRDPACVHVAIASSLMKLNPRFIEACGQIARCAPHVQLHFFDSAGDVLALNHLQRVLAEMIPDGAFTIHGFHPYPDYMRMLNDMDMFLSPFPFGNTNGIVDAFTVGLPGVCKTGREVFERIDGAMFMRAYMPGWLVADTKEEYVEAAVRLANNREERESLRRYMLEKNVVQRFFEGRPEVFGEMVLGLVEKQKAEHASPRRA